MATMPDILDPLTAFIMSLAHFLERASTPLLLLLLIASAVGSAGLVGLDFPKRAQAKAMTTKIPPC